MDPSPTYSERSEHLFVVRIWQEHEQIKTGGWRGSIDHVPSGRRLYFVSLNDLNDFIRLRLNTPLQDVDHQTQPESWK